MIARHQHEHEAINSREYPGTRQLCATCDEHTERCEEDAIYTEEGEGPLCVECWHKTPEWILENASDQATASETPPQTQQMRSEPLPASDLFAPCEGCSNAETCRAIGCIAKELEETL
jgi:hypothetical protein